jgi:hypothetical protein
MLTEIKLQMRLDKIYSKIVNSVMYFRQSSVLVIDFHKTSYSRPKLHFSLQAFCFCIFRLMDKSTTGKLRRLI